MTLRTATDGDVLFSPFVDPQRMLQVSGARGLEVHGCLRGYLGARLNHVSRSPYCGRDPAILGMADNDCCEGFPADGTVERLGRASVGWYRYRYTEGPRDKAFMEQKDREYLTALKDADDPAMRARFEEEFATLNLSLEHHRNLKREFEPFTRAYREAAGGGGEGGGPQPPAADAASTPPDTRAAPISSEDHDASVLSSEAAGRDEQDGESESHSAASVASESSDSSDDETPVLDAPATAGQVVAQIHAALEALPSAMETDHQGFVTRLEARLRRSETKSARLKDRLQRARSKHQALTTRVRALTEESASSRAKNTRLTHELSELKEAREADHRELQALRETVAALQSWRSETQPTLTTLTTQAEDTTTRVSQLEVTGMAERERTQALSASTDQLRTDHEALERDLREALSGAVASISALEDHRTADREHTEGLATRLSELAERHARQETAFESLQTSLLSSIEAMRSELKASQRDIQGRVQTLRRRMLHTDQETHQLGRRYHSLRRSLVLGNHMMMVLGRQELELHEAIHEGRLSTVYRATWQKVPCAYKQLRLEGTARETFRERALALTGMRHPHVSVPYGITIEPMGMVTAYESGGSLHAWVRSQRTVAWQTHYRFAHEMAQGLAYLHSRGMVHGQLTSKHVLLDGEQRIKLSHYGLGTEVTRRETTVIAYMAPEQLSRPEQADPRSDIYSLGMVLWEMMTQQTPFHDTSDTETLKAKILAGDEESIPEAAPSAYKALIERCWSKPRNRPKATELVRSLAGLTSSTPRAEDAGPTP